MARKFFNQKVKSRRRSALGPVLIIIGCAVMILIIVMLILNFSKNNNHDDAIIKIRDSVSVEMNGRYPDKTTFFAELKNVDENSITIDYGDSDIAVPGAYKVTLTIYNKDYYSTLVVLDNVAPVLTLKTLTIMAGDSYKASDFVETCVDNSNMSCFYEFFKNAVDSNGNEINFGAYEKEGTYIIKIVAYDEAGNATDPVETQLNIIKDDTKNKCNYGSIELKADTPISIKSTDTNCALNLKAYNDPDLVAATSTLIGAEKSKLSNEFKEINLNTENVNIDAEIIPVFNAEEEGFVGYLVNITVYIQRGEERDVIEQYYINLDGSRTYSINKYDLK